VRYECVRDDIPVKWHELDLLPGLNNEWILIQSNGIVDPSKTELIRNQPAAEFRGTFEQANIELEKRIKTLEQLGYVKVEKKTDDTELLQP
jgi:hypothetical protein